jgi:membrane protease YdiL (CAAX protease family)
MKRFGKETSALIELGILFIPSVPALLWLWPNVRDADLLFVLQIAAYVYVLAGVLLIGLRRWSWSQLGVNRRGIVLSLACGSVLIAEQVLARLTLGVPFGLAPFQLPRFARDAVFYFGFVGFTEELLFRGLLFRALQDRFGAALAVFGSSAAFALWHIGWAGPLMIGHFLAGLLFGLIRLRAGGIAGLVFIHGLDDFLAEEAAAPITTDMLRRALNFQVADRLPAYVGDLLLLGVVIYLLFVHPRIHRSARDSRTGGPPK